jgi:hypothetical protein
MPVSGGGNPAKKPAKRGPTKAEALKTLGLSQEDLDAIKKLKEIRAEVEDAKTAVEASAPPKVVNEYTAEKVEELRERHTRTTEELLRDEIAQLRAERESEQSDLSHDRQLMNQGWSASAPQAEGHKHVETVSDTPVFYARNLRGVEVRFRLSRQQKSDTKSTTLKPRGSRKDMVLLEPEDLKDSELRTQVAYNLVEIIPEGEALSIIDKQGFNAQQPGARPIEQMLRNEKGAPMVTEANPDVVHTDALPFEQQGTTVARLNPQENSPTGELPSMGRGIDWAKARNVTSTDPVQPGVGQGPIVSDGYADEASLLAARDKIARQRGASGPSGGLGHMRVTVEPPKQG